MSTFQTVREKISRLSDREKTMLVSMTLGLIVAGVGIAALIIGDRLATAAESIKAKEDVIKRIIQAGDTFAEAKAKSDAFMTQVREAADFEIGPLLETEAEKLSLSPEKIADKDPIYLMTSGQPFKKGKKPNPGQKHFRLERVEVRFGKVPIDTTLELVKALSLSKKLIHLQSLKMKTSFSEADKFQNVDMTLITIREAQ